VAKGGPQQGATGPRTVFARFVDTDTKHTAFKSSMALREERVYRDMDLTPLQQELHISKRRRLPDPPASRCPSILARAPVHSGRGARIFCTHNGGRMEARKGPSPGRAHAPPCGHSTPRDAPAPVPVSSAFSVTHPQVPATLPKSPLVTSRCLSPVCFSFPPMKG